MTLSALVARHANGKVEEQSRVGCKKLAKVRGAPRRTVERARRSISIGVIIKMQSFHKDAENVLPETEQPAARFS